MAIPMIIGRAISKVTAPVAASACRIPTAAEALWMTLVNTMPTRIPSRGFAKEVMALMNTSLSRRGSTAPLMAVMPYISTAKPSRISPTWRVVCFLLIIRTTQESLKTVPQSYREGALALGAGKWHMVRTVVLPGAVDGIVTGCILAIGRIVGESAALLYTAGFGMALVSLFDSLHTSSATLTVALYVYATEGGETALAFSIATILMVLTLLINLTAGIIGRKLKRK